jgi:RNA polymerase sigma-70 factor (ECF subfamily)
MQETSLSLLERLSQGGDPAAWQRLVDLYTPLLHAWLGRQGVQPADRDDLTQEVLGVVVRELPAFQYNRRAGAFRCWLRSITAHQLRRFWRARGYRPPSPGGSDFEEYLSQLEDPDSGLGGEWDREHDRYLLRRLLESVEHDFRPATWQAFRRLVLDHRPAAEVAAELGLSVNAVLIAKSRVLERLRQEGRGLID